VSVPALYQAARGAGAVACGAARVLRLAGEVSKRVSAVEHCCVDEFKIYPVAVTGLNLSALPTGAPPLSSQGSLLFAPIEGQAGNAAC
jgi:hypothetical protein